MHKKDIDKIIAEGSIRKVFGGVYEWWFHSIMMVLPITIIYFLEVPIDGELYMLPIYFFSFLSGWTVLNYKKVGKVHFLGAVEIEQFGTFKNYLKSSGYEILQSGKYSIHARMGSEALISSHDYVLLLYKNSGLYAAAWRYASRGWEYNPFYTGNQTINEMVEYLHANKRPCSKRTT